MLLIPSPPPSPPSSVEIVKHLMLADADHDLCRSYCSLAARRGVDPVQAARMTGHALDTWTRH
jgi:hypothetical protein